MSGIESFDCNTDDGMAPFRGGAARARVDFSACYSVVELSRGDALIIPPTDNW
ncbi:hypothetical protein ACWC2T_40970 [Streptomyces sp. NPDC001393]